MSVGGGRVVGGEASAFGLSTLTNFWKKFLIIMKMLIKLDIGKIHYNIIYATVYWYLPNNINIRKFPSTVLGKDIV